MHRGINAVVRPQFEEPVAVNLENRKDVQNRSRQRLIPIPIAIDGDKINSLW